MTLQPSSPFRTLLAAAIALVALHAGPAAAGQQAGAEEQPAKPPSRIFVFEDRPSIRFGTALRLDLTTKLDADVRESDVEMKGGTFEFGHRRIGIEGRLFGDVGFEIERELHDDDQQWRDVFVELRTWRAFRVRGGRFKIPFGRERLTSISQLDFINRSLASEALTPGRDTGVQASGRVLGDLLAYRAGVFRHDGDESRKGTDAPGARTVAGGVTLAPFSGSGSPALESFEIGTAATVGDVPSGLNGLHAVTVGGFEATAPLYVAGRRVRFGVDTRWERGPISLKAEWIRVREERQGQGLRDEDLPDVLGTGWYAGGTWIVFGALRNNGAPRKGLDRGGIGAIQLAARVEALGFASDMSGLAPEDPLRNPRAVNIRGNDVRAETIGVNWIPIRFVRLQFNLIREHFEDPDRRPDPERSFLYTRIFRMQFAW